jgi:hypothetical protein
VPVTVLEPNVIGPADSYITEGIPDDFFSAANAVHLSLDSIFNFSIVPGTNTSASSSIDTETVFGLVDSVPNLIVLPPWELDFPFYQFPVPWLQGLEPNLSNDSGNDAVVGSLLVTTDLDRLDSTQLQTHVRALMSCANLKVAVFLCVDRPRH